MLLNAFPVKQPTKSGVKLLKEFVADVDNAFRFSSSFNIDYEHRVSGRLHATRGIVTQVPH